MTATIQARAVYLDPGYYSIDGLPLPVDRRSCPPDTFTGGLGSILDRMAAIGAGTVVLSRPGMDSLGLPEGQPVHPDGRPAGLTVHPALDHARVTGWQCSGLRDYTIMTRTDHAPITLVMEGWLDRGRQPLSGLWFEDMTAAYALWQKVTGTTWRGTPGVAGTAVLADQYPARFGRPTWAPKERGPALAMEHPYRPEDWTGPFDLQTHISGLDATRMYQTAAGAVSVAGATLREYPGDVADHAAHAGWWEVELGEWTHPTLPNPAGYGPATRPITTPTLLLLDELLDRAEKAAPGAFAPCLPYVVRRRWTAPARRLFRGWADLLEAAYAAPHVAEYDPVAARLVRRGAKDAGRETIGLFNAPGHWMYRPDWHYAIIALARSNLFRKILSAVRGGSVVHHIDTDCVWFAHGAGRFPVLPNGFRLENQQGMPDTPGTFKRKGTKEIPK